MTFTFPLIFWIGLPMIALPAIIHLLNLRRQQRIPWAAMQFLLESQQKSKTWINLKELILLLLRTAAVAVLVLLLAQPSLQSGWINQWLGEPTHHIILLDDSYSASDRFADTSAWRQSRDAALAIVRRVGDQSQANRVSLIRFSEATNGDEKLTAEVLRHPLQPQPRDQLLQKIETWQPTASSAALTRALDAAAQLVGDQPDERVVLHVLADFRERDLRPADQVEQSLALLRDRVEHLHLVGSVRDEHANLAVSRLEVADGTPAAGIEVWIEVAVQNFGRSAKQGVVVEISQDGQPLSAVTLGDIPPGETLAQRFRTRFPAAGSHQMVARIDDDAIAVDNARYLAVEIPEAQRALLVDGSPQEWESYYLATALTPGGGTRTGWETEIVTPDKLLGIDTLDRFSVVALTDVRKLDEASLQRVEQFVANGGGLFVALGESIDREFYQQTLFRQGAGLLPVPPALPTQWLPDESSNKADITVSDHPLLRVFASETNSFLPLLKVDYYYAAARGWQQQAPAETKVIAKLASGAPLVAVRTFGTGRVVQQLTRVAAVEGDLGVWSNWSLNPAFPVLTNETFAWLAAPKQPARALDVGDVVSEPLAKSNYTGTVRIVAETQGVALDTQLTATDGGEWLQLASPPLVDPGVYSLHLAKSAGGDDVLLWSVNPVVAEGDTRLAPPSTLQQKLSGDNVTFAWADSLISSTTSPPGGSLVEWLLGALVAVLAIEQVFAYVCSYHD